VALADSAGVDRRRLPTVLRRAAGVAVLTVLLAAGSAAGACRTYLKYGDYSPMIGDGPPYAAVFDGHGIPIVRYPFGRFRNPATVAEWGLQEYSFWCLRGERKHLRTAVRAARWLANTQKRGGGWHYEFDYREGPVQLRPPWISALAQGRAISLLARVHESTHRRRFLRTARRALKPFLRTFEEGGVVSRWDGHPWYEEYPGVNANHVLNGYEISLLGLNDFARRSLRAARLFRAGVRSLVWAIPEFDGGPTGSYYAAGQFGPVGDGYLAVHVELTREMYRVTGRRILRKYARRWAAALRSHGSE
jgi:heparosan-N-sulfate-glucuronate 5-epimerase